MARVLQKMLLAGVIALAALVVTAPPALAQQTLVFDIASQPLPNALKRFAAQANMQLLYRQDVVEDSVANEVIGQFDKRQALHRLLEGTDLEVVFSNDQLATIRTRVNTVTRTANSDSIPLQLAQVGSRAGETEGESAAVDPPQAIQEIVVTATKRAQSLQRLPMSVSAIGAADIAKRGLVGMEDYLGSVPGVSMIDQGVGRNQVIIRGISADPTFGDPTAGIYFGDIPVTGLGYLGGSADIKMVDMQRVEVLRGPQGTLYGSGSLAGTVRNLPIAPELAEVGGSLNAGYSSTAGAGSDNTKIVGTINLPLMSDTVAVRASAYRFENSGFLENRAADDPDHRDFAESFGVAQLAANADDIGRSTYTGGRAAVRWKPISALDVTMTVLAQDLEQIGVPEAELEIGKFRQARLQLGEVVGKNSEGLVDDIDIQNLVVNYEMGQLSLVSSTSWLQETSARYVDLSFAFGVPTSQWQGRDTNVFDQELRLVSAFSGPFQFVAGLFYEDIDGVTEAKNRYSGDEDLNPQAEIDLFNFVTSTTTTQKALFGEVSYRFNERLQLTAGGRAFEYDNSVSTAQTGAFTGLPPGESSLQSSEAANSGNSGKLNLSFTPGAGVLLYAQWAEGFRIGKPQFALVRSICDINSDGLLDGTTLPIDIDRTDPDTLNSYEVGGKWRHPDGRLTVNAAIYHNDWNGIPVTVFGSDSSCGIVANAGKARTRGAEVELSWLALEQLRFDLGGSYSEAQLTEDAAGLNGSRGDRLPGSPRFNSTLAVQYDFQFANRPVFVRTDYAWIGEFYSDMKQLTQPAGDYGLVNFKLGAAIDSLSIEAFVRNLTNEDEFTHWNPAFAAGSRLRPRTFGVDIGYRF